MRELHTIVKIVENKLFSHHSKFLLLGSCFSENMAERLSYYKFQALSNPFGILFNPYSIANALECILEDRVFECKDLFFYNGLWHSHLHHGSFSAPNKETVLEKINNAIRQAHSFLNDADCLALTFGSSRVYERHGSIVANCHKLPQQEFTERRLSVSEIVDKYSALIEKIYAVNPKIQLILSVSPIRYLGNGAAENSLNKATLLLSIDELQKRFTHIIYFPAYEILLDELRDYRFFAEDMIHPSELTKKIVWERFSEAFFSTDTLEFLPTIERLNKMLAHRNLHNNSEEQEKFIKKRNLLQQKVDNYLIEN